MLLEISTRHFEEWRAYAEIEPFGEHRADRRTASIVQTLVGSNAPLEDFMIRFDATVPSGSGANRPAAPSPAARRANRAAWAATLRKMKVEKERGIRRTALQKRKRR